MIKKLKIKKDRSKKNKLRIALFTAGIALLLGLLIYFGPRILGFAILQQPSTTITLKIGTYDKTTSWNSTGLVSWYKFDEATGNTTADTSGNNTGTIYRGDYTKLLLHADGSNGSTTFTDSSIYGKTVTANGQAHTDTQYQKFGTASARFDGTGDYLSTPDHADWDFGAGDFTIDFWVRFNAVDRFVLYEQKVDGSNVVSLYMGAEQPPDTLYFWAASGGVGKGYFYISWSPSANTWYHLTIVRSGNTPYVFVNGVSQSVTNPTALSTFPDLASQITIGYGTQGWAPYYLNGSLDELRISKGIARWSANFTVPSAAYSAINVESNGKWTDVAFTGKALKFDGLGDYIKTSFSDESNFDFSDDFSLFAWIKTSDTQERLKTIINKYYSPGGGAYIFSVGETAIGGLGTLVYYNGSSWKGGGNTRVDDGAWHQVAVVVDNEACKFYVDGNIDGTNTTCGSILNNNELWIGRQNHSAATNFFNGTLDEIKIWNRSLSSEEIWHEYQGRSGVYQNFTMRTEPYACDSYTVALWHFDDSSSDNCQNHGGTLNMTGTHDNYTSGKFGKAVQFDGAGDYVYATDSADWNFGTSDFTVDLWVKVYELSNNDLGFVGQNAGTTYWSFFGYSTSIYFQAKNAGSWVANYNLIWSPSNGTWYHVALTRSNSTIYIFINGVSQILTTTTAISTNSMPNVAASLIIGTDGQTSDYFTNGTIDELRISNKSRSPDEFREFYRQGTYRKQWDSTTTATEWKTLAWNVSRASKYNQELKKDDSAVLLMHFNNDSSVGEAYNTSNGTIINDYSDGNNNGTLYTGANSGITYSSTAGKFNGAFTFDGKDDYVSVANTATLDIATAITWEAWIKPKVVDTEKYIMAKMAGTGNWFSRIGVPSGQVDCIIYAPTAKVANGAGVTLTTDTWYHHACTYDGSTIKVYIDGIEVGSLGTTGSISTGGTIVAIGTEQPADLSRSFNGTIDEVAIYNRSLADWEIQDHFERGEEVRRVWLQTRSSTNNITWTEWTGNVPAPQPNEQITNASGQENGTLLQLSFDDFGTKAQTLGQRGYKGYDNEKPYSYTKLLLHADGTNGSTTFTDSSIYGKTVTANGQAHTDTQYQKFGTASGRFDGTGDYLNVSDSADWNFGTGDFTIDTWVRFNSVSGEQFFVYQNVPGNSDYFYFRFESGKLHISSADEGLNQGNFITTNSVGFSTNIWYHIALVRSGSNAYMFVDGVSQALTTTVAWGTLPDVEAQLKIGIEDASNYINGSLDEFRISKGIARWTANFTVPSSYSADIASPAKFLSAFNISGSGELKYPTGASVDDSTVLLCRFDNSYACDTGQNGTMSVDGYTKLLLHADGTNGTNASSASDSATGKTVAGSYGQAHINTEQSKFGGSSVRFDGTGDYITFADSADWNFGTGDFTLDFWVRFNTVDRFELYEQKVDGSNYVAIYMGSEQPPGTLYFNANSGGVSKGYFYISWSPSTNTWYHVAIVRSGSTPYIFIDGVSQTVTTPTALSTLPDLAAQITIGTGSSGWIPHDMNGWIDEFRISKGTARWTSAFTVPTAQYPFEFETGKYGQGAKFNANATYITLKDSDDWAFGAGDFTIDAWVRFNSVSGYHGLFGTGINTQSRWAIDWGGGSVFNLIAHSGGSAVADYRASFVPVANTWYHFAWVRSSGVFYAFIDGDSKTVTISTDLGAGALPDPTDTLQIGSAASNTELLNGSLDEFRITKGRARTSDELYRDYVNGNLNKTAGTINFWLKPEGWAGNDNNTYKFYETSDADNAPFIRIGKDANNSLFFNVNNGTDNATKLLLHMDGSNGSTTFTDSGSSPTPKTVITNGQAHITTSQSKFGGASGFFDGTGDYLNLSDSADWNFGTGDFTIDTWVRLNSLVAINAIFSQFTDGNNGAFLDIQTSGELTFQIYVAGLQIVGITTSGASLTTNTWYHVAVVHSGTTYTVYVNGVSKGSVTDSDNWPDYTGVFEIGEQSQNNRFLNGWLDEFRISKGIARWTSNFTVPTLSYPLTSVITFPILNWTANNWTHVAATWDSANMKLYINGSQASSTTSPSGLASVNLSSSMYIGSNALGKEQCNCSIDDFAIYNYPKTSPKALGYTTNTGESVACASGRYIEVRAIFGTKDIEKTVTLGTIIITAEDRILWVTPAYEGTTIINGTTMTVNINFTDTSTTLYDVECNISNSGGTNMWGVYVPQSKVLSNTTFNITDTIDVSSWAEGNYSMTCRLRDQ